MDRPELKNALITAIKLDHDKAVDLSLSLEEKSLIIGKKLIQMFETVKNNPDYDISNFNSCKKR